MIQLYISYLGQESMIFKNYVQSLRSLMPQI